MKQSGPRSAPPLVVLVWVMAVLGVLMIAAAAWSGETQKLRFAKGLVLLHDRIDGKGFATIMPGVPLRVLAEKRDWIEVVVTGWSPAGGERYLFSQVGQRIRVAKIADDELSRRKVLGKREDYYGDIWQEVQLTGWIRRMETAADVTDVWDRASRIFRTRCTRCHALHRPTEFTANQWASILRSMTVRAGLSADHRALVIQYLQTHAKDRHPTGAAGAGRRTTSATARNAAVRAPTAAPQAVGKTELTAAGAALFRSRNCSACHGADADTPIAPDYPKLAGQNADYTLKQLRDFKSGARSNDASGVMRQNVAGLSEVDMRAIARWLAAQ